MYVLNILGRVTTLAELLDRFDQQVIIGRLMRIVTGTALSLGVWRMAILDLLGQIGMAGETEIWPALLEQLGRIR